MVDGDECVLWKRDVNEDLNDVGLVLLEDSDDALDISGQEICRFLLFLPERREYPVPAGCLEATVCLSSRELGSGGRLDAFEGDCFR